MEKKIMATVYLKDNKSIEVPFDEVEQWVAENRDQVESRTIKVRGKRRLNHHIEISDDSGETISVNTNRLKEFFESQGENRGFVKKEVRRPCSDLP